MVKVTEEMKAQVQKVFEELNKLTGMTREANPGTDGQISVQNWYCKYVDEYHGALTLYGLDAEDGSGFECADIERNGDVTQKFIKRED